MTTHHPYEPNDKRIQGHNAWYLRGTPTLFTKYFGAAKAIIITGEYLLVTEMTNTENHGNAGMEQSQQSKAEIC